MRRSGPAVLLAIALAAAACAPPSGEGTLTFSGSNLGAEGAVIRLQLERFSRRHPDARAELRLTPDAADHRHQLYVQWLNARSSVPDVLQLDAIWTPEFAAAGWILPLDRFDPPQDFFPASLEANRWRGARYAVPWFIDVGMLYRRTDLVPDAPASVASLRAAAAGAIASGEARVGLVWQGARYEGLVTVFLEHLVAHGGRILDEQGAVVVDEPAAVQALTFMRDAIHADGIVPPSVLTAQEEQTRFAFQNGHAAFMRNWPYAWTLLQDASSSRVAGRVAVSAFPAAEGGSAAATLGGGQLAINAHSRRPDAAWALVAFLLEPEQMLERARIAGQFPPRQSAYEDPRLADALALPPEEVRDVIEHAAARPATPVYTELSEILQVRLHRALSRQQEPESALRDAAAEIRRLLARAGLDEPQLLDAGATP